MARTDSRAAGRVASAATTVKKKTKKRLVKDLTARGRRVRAGRRNPRSPLWRKKALSLWSLVVRRGGACAVCGTGEGLQAHHLLPKERYQWLAFETINGLCLCHQCHKIGRLSAHRNPIWFARWLAAEAPRAHAWAVAHIKTSGEGYQADYQKAYERLLREAVRLGVALEGADRAYYLNLAGDDAPAGD